MFLRPCENINESINDTARGTAVMNLKTSTKMLVLMLVFCCLRPVAAGDSPRSLIPEASHELKTLPQNWSDDEAEWFYNAPQGSYLLRYEWFINLEQAESASLFRDSANFRLLGYLPRLADSTNPDGLAVGFVRDEKESADGTQVSYVGMTCAACHTGHINFARRTYVIDGAPTNGNFEKLQRNLVAAIEATLADNPKFDRFAAKVVGQVATISDKAKLKAQLQSALVERKAYNERNLPKNGAAPFGHGRVDAFGAIMNEVAVRFAQVRGNASPANAPVSYPVLWDAPQHDFVQWNGAAENKRNRLLTPLVGTEHIGALGRNTGEVLGVFGEIDASIEPSIRELRHYPNSAKRDNLIAIEDSIRELWSPQWPADFPPINQELKNKGAILFKQYCAKCHEGIVRNSSDRRVVAKLSDVGTDPQMATNFLTRKGWTGVLNGRRVEPLSANLDTFAAEAPVGLMLKHLVQRAIIRPNEEILREGEQKVTELVVAVGTAVDYQVTGSVSQSIGGAAGLLSERFRFGGTEGIRSRARDGAGLILQAVQGRLSQAITGPEDIRLHYKARPLNGIWASAPYLHNGSIPNLDELLKRPGERSKAVFKVGSREFDPVKVGFRTDVGEDFDPRLPGNLSVGHDFGHQDGRAFSGDERMQLIEYMKSL